MHPPLSSSPTLAPKCLSWLSRRQRSSSFPRPTCSEAHRCSRLTRQNGGEQSGPVPLTLKVVLVAQPREAFRHQRGKRRAAGAYSGGMPTYSLFILTASVGRIVFRGNCLWGESSVGRDVHWAKRPWGETSMGQNVLPWGEVSMGRNVRGVKSP